MNTIPPQFPRSIRSEVGSLEWARQEGAEAIATAVLSLRGPIAACCEAAMAAGHDPAAVQWALFEMAGWWKPGISAESAESE